MEELRPGRYRHFKGGEYEVLCHEFKCQNESGGHVLVYVNAQTGQQQKILLLLEDESGTLVI